MTMMQLRTLFDFRNWLEGENNLRIPAADVSLLTTKGLHLTNMKKLQKIRRVLVDGRAVGLVKAQKGSSASSLEPFTLVL